MKSRHTSSESRFSRAGNDSRSQSPRSNSFSFFFRKYPAFRAGIIFALAIIAFFAVLIFTRQTRRVPAITSVTPSVGSPGDVMIINGINFGSTKTSSDYVEVSGSRITASGFLSWSDTQIKLVLPQNAQDGLIKVGTKFGVSKPSFFANEASIPVEVPSDTTTSLPSIASVSPSSLSVGNILTINGANFGSSRNSSEVFFTANRDDTSSSSLVTNTQKLIPDDIDFSFVAANSEDFDYEYWSDSELRVRVPDGAKSGRIYVSTENGESNSFEVEVKNRAGTKEYSARRTYLIELTVDIENINSKSDTSLTLRVPRPPVTSSQPMSLLTECEPQPVLENHRNNVIHKIDFSKLGARTLKFKHNFAVAEYSVQTNINPSLVKPFSETSRILYIQATVADRFTQEETEALGNLASAIVKNETNPYRQAKLIYDYMIDNYSISSARQPEADPLDLIKENSGDAYDFAIIYTELLRSLKIPAVCVGGILVDLNLKTQSHWWTEFYIENFGWVPVDTALGAGMQYRAFRADTNAREYYFGNLDSQHIAFSRGRNETKLSLTNGTAVTIKRSYALQSIWEESSVGTVNYSSLWNIPIVRGIY